MTRALLIIDMQNDYFPGGVMELDGSLVASENARLLLEGARRKGIPIYHVQHLSARPSATFFLPGTHGVEIHAHVRPLPGETVVQKQFPNSFRQTPLLEALHRDGITHLVVAGMMTHMCVDATVRAAFDLGFQCTLAHDACAARSLALGEVLVSAHQVHVAFVAALHGLYAEARPAGDIIRSF